MFERQKSLLVLVIIAVISVGGFVLLYDDTITSNLAFRPGQRFLEGKGMTYSQPVMLCERLIGEGKIPKIYEYEAIYSEMVNRFGANNCVDGTSEIGYWCCDPSVLGRYL